MRIHHIVLILLSLLLQPAYAADNDGQCNQAVFDVLSRFYQKPLFAQPDKVVASACKLWPYKPNLTLAAVAFDESVAEEKTLVVAVLDLGSNQLVSGTKQEIGEDALVEFDRNSLSLDTARWQLSDTTRAFGVYFHSSAIGASCGQASWSDELTLYVSDKQDIRAVLTMPMQYLIMQEGCTRIPTQHEITQNGSRTIAIANTSHHGLADLLVTESVTVDEYLDSEAVGNTKHQKHQYLFKYDGKSYIYPGFNGIFFK